MRRLLSTLCLLLIIFFAQTQQKVTYTPNLKNLHVLIDSLNVNLRAEETPLIGLSASYQDGTSRLSNNYVNAIIKAGGAPVIIPVTTDDRILQRIVAQLDGLILTGGADINPLLYNEQPIPQLQTVDPHRDQFDLTLLKLATDRNVPVLGICRGHQLINIAFGGTLYQDIPSQRKGALKHGQSMPSTYGSHSIGITPDTQLAAILGNDSLFVNSSHHQAVKDLAPGFKVAATATDGVIEAIEAWPNRPIMGVQWHPEGLVAGENETMLNLFRFLVGKADTFRLAKAMHERILTVDTHTDTPLWFSRTGFNLAEREQNLVNLPKMEEGKLDGVFLAAYIGQRGRTPDSLQWAVNRISGIIDNIYEQVEQNKDLCDIAVTPADFIRLKQNGKAAIFIGIENGYGIGKDLSNIEKFRKRGVTYITLCHSYDNDICDTSSRTKNEWGGLSPFGQEVILEMNRQGIIVDLSHAGESTFWDVLKLSDRPVICSHSSAYALCKHDRNLTDEQLRALAQNGGVIQLCLLDSYINPNRREASLTDAIDHIDHIVKVAGIDHIGIGSDFDGGGGLIGCQAANDLIQITVKLIERGYSEEDIAKIWGGNFMRVMKQVQENATVNI